MPILRRTSFTNKNDAKFSLKYLFYGHHRHLNQPKHQNESGVRNLVVDGYGLNPTSYLTAYRSMKYYFNRNHGSRGLLNLVMSFPKTDFPQHAFNHINSPWALIVDELAKKFAITAFGHDHQFIDCVQNDGVNHNVHSHVFVNLVSTVVKTKSDSFRSMPGRVYNAPRLSKIASAITNKFNREHGTRLTTNPRRTKLTKSQAHIYGSVHRVINNASVATIADFERKLNRCGVRPNFNHKHNQVVGLSFDYFPSRIVLSGYSNHIKSSTLSKKAHDPGLRFYNILKRFNANCPNLFNSRKHRLKEKFAKLLNSNSGSGSRYVNQLVQVVKLSPDNEQRKQAKQKIKAVSSLKNLLISSNKVNDRNHHNDNPVRFHRNLGPSL